MHRDRWGRGGKHESFAMGDRFYPSLAYLGGANGKKIGGLKFSPPLLALLFKSIRANFYPSLAYLGGANGKEVG